jgi:putative phosphoribosyl transferase
MAMFRDRLDAAIRLAQALGRWRGSRPLVLAIPRGAVPMGRVVADRLGGDLDVVLARKLHAPGSPEFAVGAIDETGWIYVADHAERVGANAAYLERESAIELAAIRRRRADYTPGRAPVDPAGRVTIVVDDGLATGSTMIAALHALRARAPARLICAVPVASSDAIERVTPYADEVVCLATPPEFHAVGQFYLDFTQVDDTEVKALLQVDGEPPESRAPG